VRQVAEASTTGHGTNVIAGVALGMEATAMPVIVISIAIISAYWLGKMSGLQDDQGQACGGLKFSKVLYIVTFCLVNVLGH
jgi:Na+/H+-translocating membrane pyrophosphatase